MSASALLPIRDASDLAVVRRHVRAFGSAQGLGEVAVEALATAVTEIARNVLDHADGGVLRMEPSLRGAQSGVAVTVQDCGPGIADLAQAMQDGYSTRDSLGMGLPGARSLVDDFEIDSQPGRGTTVRLWKWAG
jgi:serine/threonine-protein kinase RsbT